MARSAQPAYLSAAAAAASPPARLPALTALLPLILALLQSPSPPSLRRGTRCGWRCPPRAAWLRTRCSCSRQAAVLHAFDFAPCTLDAAGCGWASCMPVTARLQLFACVCKSATTASGMAAAVGLLLLLPCLLPLATACQCWLLLPLSRCLLAVMSYCLWCRPHCPSLCRASPGCLTCPPACRTAS